MKKLIALLITLTSVTCIAQKIDPEITVSDLKSYIGFLASDSLKGRLPGTPEDSVAAGYIKQLFIGEGIKPIGNSYYQYFSVTTKVEAGKNNKLSFNDFDGQLNQDFIPLSYSANATVKAGVVFAGYGFDLDIPGLQWKDYDAVDVKGKWVLVLQADPEIDSANSKFIAYSEGRAKVLTAKDKGAAGVLFVSGEKLDKKDVLTPITYDKSLSGSGIPVIHIKRSVADKMLAATGKNIALLENQLNNERKPSSFEIAVNLSATSEVLKSTVTTRNVIGMIEGNDPELKKEYVVIGAHYDHLGMGGPGSNSRKPDTIAIHNGADDNASGVAAVIELAGKLAAHRENLKRSLIFVTFSGEELGLLGSKYFVAHPPVPVKQMRAMINLDMVGRLKPDTRALTVYGTGTFAGADSIVKKYSAEKNLAVTCVSEGTGPSDQLTFYLENIPVLFFFTGFHPDYHTPSDDANLINYEGEKDVADVVYSVANVLASGSVPLVFKESGSVESNKNRRSLKVTLGIVPDFASTEKSGLRVDGVKKGGPASNAGLKKGDIIISINGKTIANIYDYMARLSKFNPGDRINVELIRDGQKIIVVIDL